MPFVVRGAVDRGISRSDGASLARWTVLLVVVGGIGAYCAGMRRYLAFRQARAAETQLRYRLFAHLLRLDAPFWDRAAAGDLISRAASDLQQIQNALNMLPITIGNAVIVVAVTVVSARPRPGAGAVRAGGSARGQPAGAAVLGAAAPADGRHATDQRRRWPAWSKRPSPASGS